MPKATYNGPGDAVEFDGIRVEKGETLELTSEQILRIRAAGGDVDAEPGGPGPEDTAKIHATQAKRAEVVERGKLNAEFTGLRQAEARAEAAEARAKRAKEG